MPEDFFYVGNSSVKRPPLEAAGRFDEDFPYHAWEDHELGLRERFYDRWLAAAFAAGYRRGRSPGPSQTS